MSTARSSIKLAQWTPRLFSRHIPRYWIQGIKCISWIKSCYYIREHTDHWVEHVLLVYVVNVLVLWLFHSTHLSQDPNQDLLVFQLIRKYKHTHGIQGFTSRKQTLVNFFTISIHYSSIKSLMNNDRSNIKSIKYLVTFSLSNGTKPDNKTSC